MADWGLKHVVFLKIFIKWQLLKTLLSVLNIDKSHKDGTMKSEREKENLVIFVTFRFFWITIVEKPHTSK
jgi:hypothetical protein